MATALNFLSAEQLASYHETGYLVLRGVLSEAESMVLQHECDRLLTPSIYTDPKNIRAGYRHTSDGPGPLERLDPVHDTSSILRELVRDERILAPLRDVFSDEPRLFKDKLIFKLPGVGGYTMHQDAAYWQVFPYDSLVSVMVAIDGANRENGGLELFAGYHERLLTTPGELRNFTEDEAAKIDESRGELIETNPGDLVIFTSLTPHRSGHNTSDRSRKQLFLTYAPARCGELYKAHYQHYQRYKLKGDDPSGYFFA